MSKTYAVPPAPPQNHGKTVAAWTMTVGVVIAFTVAAFGLILDMPVLLAVGAGIAVITILISVGLRAAGLGQSRRSQAAAR